jgi:ubiquinone/menaquinone biosynthesis C-methylase UbiE
MEFIDSNKILLEILRVLKPGGEVGVGSWVQQTDIDWIAAAFRKHFPELFFYSGKGISGYSKEKPEGQQALLQMSGFESIRVHVETADFVSPDENTWWRQMERAAGKYFQGVSDPEKLDGFKEQVFADLDQLRCAQGIRFSKRVTFAFGIKPI